VHPLWLCDWTSSVSEARGLAEAAGVVDAAGPVEIADRNGDVQPVARTGQRDVEQPSFLLEAVAVESAMLEGRLPPEAWIRWTKSHSSRWPSGSCS
jgi:hypothetical protein